jgi:hypothetical protein
MLSMVFEVIQPDLEINRRHAATLLIPPTGSSVRAVSGSSVEGFGQILAAGSKSKTHSRTAALSSSPRRIIMLMAAITPTEAQAYFKRWELVKEIELVELRRTSMDVKLRQLSALMASRGLFGVDPERENGVQLVRDRWACLRQALRG